MTVGYVSRKCESCGSRKFSYNEKSKTWTCLYCGSTTEREERYDGLFTIKNVVRQVLLDVAYRRLDSAEKNLIECEKIDSKYIGTILANLCYLMIKVAMPGATDSEDVKSIISRIKRYNDLLQSDYLLITDEEDMLYDFFESSDIYATLLLVFDSLNDKKRSEHIEKLLRLEEVDSKETNKNLLSYSLKNNRLQLFNDVIKNSNTDKKFALTEVLGKYPDNDQKALNAEALFAQNAFAKEDKSIAEKYLSESGDSLLTKSKIFKASTAAGIKISTDVVLFSLLEKSEDAEIVKSVFSQLCASKLSDEDVYKIVGYCFGCKNVSVGVAALSALKESSQFVVLEQKHVVALLSRKDIVAEEKMSVLRKAYEFSLDNKQREVILNNYLCFNQDNCQERKLILPFLLDTVQTIATNTFENYVLKCSIDGSYKVDVIRRILQLQINTSFYNDLLAKYMPSLVDSRDVKQQVTLLLIEKGVKLDAKSFGQYVCTSTEDPAILIKFVSMLKGKGFQLKSDTLNSYLTGMTNFERFNPDLFALLLGDAHVFTEEAMKNYLLYCKDRDASKIRNVETLSRMLSTFGGSSCTVKHLGNTIDCNLLQAYVLMTMDSFEVANEIVKQMLNRKAKINAEIRISPIGKNEKLKKYVFSNKEQLSAVTDKLCEEHKVYSMLF